MKYKTLFTRYGLLLILAFIVIIASIVSPVFLTYDNLMNIIRQISMVAIIAIGATIVLIIGGGDGIPHGTSILRHLLNASLNVEIAIVCGKNKELYADALELQQQNPSLKVFAFVDFVYELLHASDIVVTKCGASTIMEILIMKKIPIINDYLWEQELGNMEFIRDNELGIFEHDTAKLPSLIQELVSGDEKYQQYFKNIDKMNVRSGTEEVGEFLRTMG